MTASKQPTILIHEGPRSLIYYQTNSQYGQPVVIKVLNADHPTDNQLIRFNNEYELTRDLKINGVRRAIALTRWEDRPALVMAYVPGLNLGQAFVAQKKSLVDFLQVAINIAHTLGHLHQQHIIHRDISSHNILVNPETKKITIIDFSLASTLDLRIQHLGNPQGLAGTLAYISPEQTGRMNRVVDHRTDLYSLGATFYELLTGHLPFEIDDPLALVHAHMAKIPTPVVDINPDVPPVLSRIVMKLLAKNAEERYQSAFGVKADLERCLAALPCLESDEDNQALNFELGQDDYSGQFHIPQTLYGRSAEIATLLDAFKRTASGDQELMLIAGQPGVGKSALVAEVHKPITEKRGYYISGKFDSYQQHTPYAAFRQAFNQLVDLLLIESKATLKKWQVRISAALGGNGAVLTEVIVHLEKIIGPQPAVMPLGGSENRNRLNITFQNFVRALSTAEHPLVIFIDDWQWADLASLELLKTLLIDADNAHLLMIGAYRDNEVDPAHPFMLTLDELSAAGVTMQSIQLDNLKRRDVDQLVQESLFCSTAESQALTELVYTKTRGNAFFTRQFLQNLVEEGGLHFNFDTCHWGWDIDQIQAQQITDNVVSLMVARLKKLSPTATHLLALAACIGNEFDLYTLALISRMSPTAVLAALPDALEQGLLLPLDDYYKLPDTANRARFAFLHDRVQQAAYAQIPGPQQQAIHLDIGRLLLVNVPDTDLEQRIFGIAEHYHRAAPLITTETERLEVAALNIKAADLANRTAAFRLVQVHLETALALMPSNAWETRYDQMLSLHSKLSTTLALTGDFDQLEKVFQTAKKKARTTSDMTPVTQAKIQALLSQGAFLEVLALGVDFIDGLGVSLNHDPSAEEARSHLRETARWLTEARIKRIPHLPAAPTEEKLILQFALGLHGPTYVARPSLYIMLNSKLTRLCIESGLAPEAMPVLINFAFMLCLIVRDVPKALLVVGTVRKLAEEKFASDSMLAFLYDIIGSYFVHRYDHLKNTLPILSQGLQKGMASGNFEFASYSIWDFTWHQLFLGTPLDQVAAMGKRALDTCQKMQRLRVKDWCGLPCQATLNLQGKSQWPWILKGEIYDEDAKLNLALQVNDFVDVFFIFFYKGWLRYLFGYPKEAIGFFREAEHYAFQGGAKYAAALLYFYDTLAYAALDDHQTADEQAKTLRRIDRNLEEIELWACFAPMNHQHKKDFMLAEKARLKGEYWQAVELYSQSIEGARDNGFLSEEALANERLGQFWLDRGREELGRVHLRKAQKLYSLWGAKAKVNQLQVDYGPLLGTSQGRSKASSSTVLTESILHACTSSRSESDGWLDIGSLLKANQSLSQTVQLTELMTEMINIVLENAGAQRVWILYRTEGDWFVEAKGEIEDRAIQTMIHTPLDEAAGLSLTVCRYVIHSGQAVMLENAATDPQFGADPYFQDAFAKSLLCMPIWRKDELRLILYLENNVAEAAFTTRRMEVLQLLSGQMAISLENALMVEKLKTSTESLRRTQFCFDNASMGIFWFGRAGEILDVNGQACRRLGYSKEALCRMTVFDIDPVFTPDMWAAAREKLKNRGVVALETSHKEKNGHVFPVQIIANMMTFENQSLHVVFAQDITKRKQMQEALLESEERLDLALSGANESIWDFRINEDALYLDSRFYAMTGYAPNAFPCNKGEILKRIHKGDIEQVTSVSDRYLKGDLESFEVEFRFLCNDHSYMWIQAKGKIVAWDDEGAPTRFVGTHADITRQKQAEEELRCLRNYLSNIIDSMPSILVAVDRDGKVTQWNNQAEQITGFRFEEALGQPLFKVLPRLADHKDRIGIAIRERRVISVPKVSRRTEQETRFEDVTIFPLVANGVDGAVIRVDDVTERVHLEEMMIQNEKMLSVGGLAAGMAHEINNPLAGILQSAAVLSNRLTRELPANQKAAVASGTTMTAIRNYMKLRKLPTMLENIRNSGTLAADIVKNMLSFARKGEQIVSKHDLCELLDQTLDLLRTDYDMKKHYDFKQIEIVRQFDTTAAKVPCEASKLQQVFMNILKNGAEAMAEYTVNDRPPAFILRVKAEQTWVRVEIEDNGPGMDEATRRRIFEPFFTTKPLGRGTGLGLSVSYFIITENHGGEMDAYRVDGGGTRFVIRLPKMGKTIS
ncbi:PAS domain S-box protein [Desulfosarcina variabilis]|uniref:PAS domain S-box protein n=1 Tax=Desulfosarcina variabilis TaxID=2300 RepID=UPI003AFB6232